MFVTLIFQRLGNSCCEIPHMVSFWREMCGGSPEDKSSEMQRALLRVCMHTRAPRCLAGDHRHILVIKWIVAQLLLQLLFSCWHMALVGATVWACWACSVQVQARFYSITESYLEAAGPLAGPQIHLFLSKAKKIEGLSWGVMSSKRHFLQEKNLFLFSLAYIVLISLICGETFICVDKTVPGKMSGAV